MYALAVKGAQEAYEKGCAAGEAGKGQGANPYSVSEQWVLWNSWRDGCDHGLATMLVRGQS